MVVNTKFSLQKVTGSHFTPRDLSEFLAQKVTAYYDFQKSDNIIWDPSCGDGNLIEALLNKIKYQNIRYFGAESDNESYCKAVERFKKHSNIKIFNEDFIKYHTKYFNQNDLFSLSPKNELRPNVIIANPPYIRTQVMGAEQAQELAELYNLKGRIDMYFAFIVTMVNFLKEDGIIAVITSNRFLFTKSGESIRKYLFDNLEILELYDLGDTKFFKAAVLPAILIGRKNKNLSKKNQIFYSKIYESNNDNSNYKEILEKRELLNMCEAISKCQFKETPNLSILCQNSSH